MSAPDATAVRTAERVVDASRLADTLERRVARHRKRPGRPRELTMRNFLVGVYLVATTGTLHLCRIAPTLNDLPTGTRKRLGLTRDGGIPTPGMTSNTKPHRHSVALGHCRPNSSSPVHVGRHCQLRRRHRCAGIVNSHERLDEFTEV